MKRILGIFLGILMLAFLVSGCKKQQPPPMPEPEAQEEAVVEEPAPEAEPEAQQEEAE